VGQFGSLYSQMKWSARNHNVFAAVNYEITPKLSVFGNFQWNDGQGSFDGLSLDPKKVSQIPPGFNYLAMSELGRYSALNAARTQDIAGLNYKLTPKWVLNATYYFARYKDRSPYLLDATGRTQGVEAGVSYMF
jgi:predicted porin